MTCCVQDIQFVGFPCSYDGYKALEQRAWVKVTAKVGYKFHNTSTAAKARCSPHCRWSLPRSR